MGVNGKEAWEHGTAHGAWEGIIPQKFSGFIALFGVRKPLRSGLYIMQGYIDCKPY